MKRWLGYSGGFHVVLLLIIVFGLPVLLDDEQLITPRIIPVDIVNISDVTNTRVSEKPNLNPTPTPTKVEKQQPPPTPEPPKEEAKPDKPVDKPDEKAEVIPDKTKPKEKEKPKEEKKKEEKKEEKKPEKKVDLTAVLKNVAKLKDDIKPQPDVVTKETDDKAVISDDVPSLGKELSISEMDALRRQIQQCWNVPIGARGIENMNIEIYIEVNEDRTVRRAEIVDRARMITDSFFRTVAESARRSLFNPRCTPLMLPEGRFADWNKIRMNFNPSEML